MIIINILLDENKETKDAGEIVKTEDAGEIVKTEDAGEIVNTEDGERIVKTEDAVETKETAGKENTSATKETSVELEQNEKESNKVAGEQQELPYQADEGQEKCIEYEDTESNTSKTVDDESRSTVSKLFVHSQWLSVQSPYFKALFYSGMKETYSKEVVMKIQEHELEAHLTLIEAMYKLHVLKDKDYRLVVQVLVLAHKYDVRHVIKKCKYVLMSTTPSLEMCEYILREITHLSDMADIYEMLEKFLVKEFTPIDETWTSGKFTKLSKAALRLLLRSDNLGTRSENTVFVALMEWVLWNISWFARSGCDLLNLVRFEFMSVDFLYDVVQNHSVASRMPGFNKYLQRGLAYHGFSQMRREQLEPKLKKRPFVENAGPTFSWVIDDELEEKLSNFPGKAFFSNRFWYHGYPMQLQLIYDSDDLSKCSLYLKICNMTNEACLCVSYTAKSSLFTLGTIKIGRPLYSAKSSSWGKRNIGRNANRTEGGYTIDVWVEIF